MRTKPWLLLAIALVLVLTGYLGALDAGFVWDDRAIVLDPMPSGHATTLTDVLTRPFWQPTTSSRTTAPYFRPVTSASFVLDRALYGQNPAGFHLTNVALHLAVCALLFGVLRRFAVGPRASALGVLFFGVAPRLTENVTWISGRTDVLATGLALAAVLAWPEDGSDARLVRHIFAALLFAAAFAAKEVAIVVPIALVLSSSAPVRDRARRLWPVVVTLVLAVAARAHVLAGAPADSSTFGQKDRAIASAEALGRYAGMILVPWRPNLQIGYVGAPSFAWVAAGVGVVIALGFLLRKTWARWSRAERFGVLVAGFAILLVLPIGPVRISVVAADRFLYLPLAGLVIALAAAATRVPARGQKALGIAALVASGVSLVVLQQANALWSDELALWLKACDDASAANSIPLTSLGAVLYRGRAYREALGVYGAVAGKTGGATREQALQNVASSEGKLGEYEKAAALRRSLVEAHPGSDRFTRDLALSELQRNDVASARDLAQRAGAGDLMLSVDTADRDRDEIARLDKTTKEGRARFLYLAADLESALDRRPEAMIAWRAVLDDPDATHTAAVEAAARLARDADADRARSDVAKLAARFPDDPELPALASEIARREAFAADVARESGRIAALSR